MCVCVFIVIEFNEKATHIHIFVICLCLLFLFNCSFVFEALRKIAKLCTHYVRPKEKDFKMYKKKSN